MPVDIVLRCLTYLLICTAVAAGGIALNWQRPSWAKLLVSAVSLFAVIFLAALPLGDGHAHSWFLDARFLSMHFASYALFGVLPVALLVLAGRALFLKRPRLAGCLLAFAGLIWAVAIDAWFIEPKWLQVTHTRLVVPELDRPVKIALLADLQADRIGPYERQVLLKALEEQPDLILFAGDYLQCFTEAEYRTQTAELQKLLASVPLKAPLGVYAVAGNVDAYRLVGDLYIPKWLELFAGTGVAALDPTTHVTLGKLHLTLLNIWESSDPTLVVPPAPSGTFHVVVGHLPNYFLGQASKAASTPVAGAPDLCLAGHVHGGQIRLPALGPITTNSLLPRRWAVGLTEWAPGKHFYVSRGIGLERNWAPRVRFLCRPELAILELVPGEQR